MIYIKCFDLIDYRKHFRLRQQRPEINRVVVSVKEIRMYFLILSGIAVWFILRSRSKQPTITSNRQSPADFGYQSQNVFLELFSDPDEYEKYKIEKRKKEELTAELCFNIKLMRATFAQQAIKSELNESQFLSEWQAHLRVLDMLHSRKLIDSVLYKAGFSRTNL